MSDYIKTHIERTCPGPHNYCNWVTYPKVIGVGRLLMTAYPYRKTGQGASEAEYIRQLQWFPKGVTIVCLQEKTELNRLSSELFPYYTPANLAKYAHKASIAHVKSIQLEIPDVNVIGDSRVIPFMKTLFEQYNSGESFIIHCLGGHGRTGTITGILYGMILMNAGITPKASVLLDWLKHCHTQRATKNGWIECPQTDAQCNQVQRLYYHFANNFDIKIQIERPLGLPNTSLPSIKYIPPHKKALESKHYQHLNELFQPDKFKTAHEQFGRMSEQKLPSVVPTVSMDMTKVKKTKSKSIFKNIFSCCTASPPSSPENKVTEKIPEKKEEVKVASIDDEEPCDDLMAKFWDMDMATPVTKTFTPPTAPPLESLVEKPRKFKAPISQLKPLNPVPKSYNYHKPKQANTIKFEMTDLY